MTDSLLGATTTTHAATTPTDGTAPVDTPPVDEQLTTTQPAEETPTESPEQEPEGEPEGAPELYEFDVPDGMPEDFALDESVIDALAKVSRELNLSQANAQKVVDELWPVMHQRAEEQRLELHNKWISETRADREIGGQQLDQNLATAKKALEVFGNDDLNELLNSPIGSHPEVVRFLVKVGKAVSEDKFVGGRPAGKALDLTDEVAVAKRLYPKSP